MRRTGSEEIGSSKALGRAGMIPGLPRLLLLVIFLVKLQSGGLGSQNTTMPGALCPASSSLLCFIGWSYPQIVLYSRFFCLTRPTSARSIGSVHDDHARPLFSEPPVSR